MRGQRSGAFKGSEQRSSVSKIHEDRLSREVQSMTPDQIDTLAQMIANSLPGLIKEKTGPQSKPMQPKNIRSLYVERTT